MLQKTIFIVDDDIEVCKSLRWLFESVNLNAEVYDSAKKFLSRYDTTKQGCLVLDVKMPDISGIDLLNKLNLKERFLPTIMITGYSDILMAIEAMKAGAVDFILKPIDDKYLLKTINYHLEKPPQINKSNFLPSKMLSKREQEVIQLIMNGKYNKEIAYELKISISTVEAHRSRIMHKYHAKNLAQLIKKYFNIVENDSTNLHE